MSVGLDSAGCDTENVLLDCTPESLRRLPLPTMARGALIRRIATSVRRFKRSFTYDRTYRSTMVEMRDFAEVASRKIDAGEFDVVVAVNMSGLVSMIESSLPVVYATDATATLANEAYSNFAGQRRGAREAAVQLETGAAERADLVLVPSDYCRRSMCRDHGADPSKVQIVPLGANLVPDSEDASEITSTPVVGGELELVVVAADPERKRVGLCADVAEMLEERGWRTRLHYIGPRHAICNRSIVEWAGQLNHGVESDRRRHREILRRAHLAILPSVSEMYGIAPIESAAFGRPSIVSGVGGLTTVVKDGLTGRCLPVETPVSGWADAIESMIIPAERYRAYSAAALHRYRQELNWGAWGRRVRTLVEELIGI
ncbi:MAG: glycosyltransferase family 4 protein [Phycisphaerales bacterium]|nr:glycosyltransferase family 4 protein [Phycisphaerales bacterium]